MESSTTREELLGKATGLKVIPTLNNIIDRVFSVLWDKNSAFRDLADVIKYDQAITSKVISIANSAYYSRGIEIFSLQRAMLNIGFEEVKSIVMGLLFAENTLKKIWKLKEEDLLALWKHSVHVASAARLLSEKTVTEDPQKVYTISLLHDIGKIIFYIGAPNYGTVVREAQARGKELDIVEREIFGIDHQEIGYVISVKWRFPEEFSYVIRNHHGDTGDARFGSLLKLVRTANRFAISSNADLGPEGYILLREQDTITKEMEKIMDFLQLR
jgi:putative nucleotidyltransferase with HDIG domain